MTKRIALFPGSFDPFTNGHLETVERASALFDEIIIAVMTNTAKKPLFSGDERVAMIKAATAQLPNIRVLAEPEVLTIHLAEKLGAQFLLRGLRDVHDFEYEIAIAQMNKTQDAKIETIFLPASAEYVFISSSMVKEVASFGGDVSGLVPPVVATALQQRYSTKD
ncbi:coaD protein [Lactobacillus selangorensis]|uniref:Phosphopantetheine adenylyltransferase n=1 Tax=Lactobacillus selangorensis TaxID=81857 RepID=A0A0R2G2D4_9LACO|nr:pantetheine-phosphate adenylyltransferase [Lactobacillus selangorensis]KRN29396.1 coaD protein [Lactobacillus selangorensis]KRN34075.1 coaD protein [Lactobacillus selangorensis]